MHDRSIDSLRTRSPAVARCELGASTLRLSSGPGTVIDGRFEASEGERRLLIVDPSTGSEVTAVDESSRRQADRAVSAARRSFDSGVWAKMSPLDRSLRIRRLAEAIDENVENFAELGALEVGTPISFGRTLHGGIGRPFVRMVGGDGASGTVGRLGGVARDERLPGSDDQHAVQGAHRSCRRNQLVQLSDADGLVQARRRPGGRMQRGFSAFTPIASFCDRFDEVRRRSRNSAGRHQPRRRGI